MRTLSVPEVEMLHVSQSSRNQRKMLTNFVPKIGLSVVDYGRIWEIDNFYLDCQNFRDYYRDPYHKIPRPSIFKRHFGKCGNRSLDKHNELLMRPVSWLREKQPVIYPINYRREFFMDEGIFLAGQHNSAPCTKFKR